MGTADPLGDDVPVGSASPALLPAAVALRWSRPDLTATLAELALDAATDADSWVVAAGWLLHGRAALGDGRDTMCDLLDGLGRWGAAGVERMAGAAGRRLRVEMAGPVRRIGEPAVARALLTAEAAVDDDTELRADVLTGLARCAVDEAPDTADDALAAAEQAWRATGCAPGLASVMLLRAARDRRAGRTDEATAQATAGVALLSVDGRPGTTASDHLAAALTAEWIAALVEAGRLDEARDTAVPAADRLIAAARTSRQVAGLRLAIARVGAVADGQDVVLAALEPAAQDAADSNAPELESACRSMLGELHEQAGRLDRALAELRAAMTAERRDRDRATRLRGLLGAATPAGRPGTGSPPPPASPADALSPGDALSPWGEAGAAGGHHEPAPGPTDLGGTAAGWDGTGIGWDRTAVGWDGSAADQVPGAPAAERPDGAGRAGRRRAAEPAARQGGAGRDDDDRAGPGWADAGLLFGREVTVTTAVPRGEVPGLARRVDTERSGAARGTRSGAASTSAGPTSAGPTSAGPTSAGPAAHRSGGSLIGDALFRELAESSAAPHLWGDGDPVGSAVAATAGTRSPLDPQAARRDAGHWMEAASASDTVVFGQAWDGPAVDRTTPDAGRSRHHGDPGHGESGPAGGSGPFRHGSTGSYPGDRPAGPHGRRSDSHGHGGRTAGPSPEGAAERAGRAPGDTRSGYGDGAPTTGPRPSGPAANGAEAFGGAGGSGALGGSGPRGGTGAHNGASALGGPVGLSVTGAHSGTGAHGVAGAHGGAAHGGAGVTTGRDVPAAPGHSADAPATPRLSGDGRATPGLSGDAGRAAPGRRPGRPAATDDGMGLADLLAGALAAYRNL